LPDRLAIPGVSFQSLADGVGHNPDTVASVERANTGSRYAVPFRVIPDLGHLPENRVKPPVGKGSDVFQQDDSWFQLANDSAELSPQPGSLAGNSSSFPDEANVLTGKTSADKLDVSVPVNKFICSNAVTLPKVDIATRTNTFSIFVFRFAVV
jgi:hypothetical protein